MLNYSSLDMTLPSRPGERTRWNHQTLTSIAERLAALSQTNASPFCVICSDNQSAYQFELALRFFLRGSHGATNILHFPDWEILPYDHFSPHEDIISDRLKVLNQLRQLEQPIIVTSITTISHYLPPTDFIHQHSFSLEKGDPLDLPTFRQRLTDSAYHSVQQVMAHGEFCIRGSLLDLFPMGSTYPVRLDLFDNTIDSIRRFDPDSQRTIEKLDSFQLLPAKEFPMTEEVITHFRQAWRDVFSGNPSLSSLYEDVSSGLSPAGIEYYIPLFFEKMSTFFDYLPSGTVCCHLGDTFSTAETFQQQVSDRFENYSGDITRPLLPPKYCFLPSNQCFEYLKQFPQCHINLDGDLIRIRDIEVSHKSKDPFAKLKTKLKSLDARVLFCGESPGRTEVLHELLSSHGINCDRFDSWAAWLKSTSSYGIIKGLIEESISLNETNTCLISEAQLFDQPVLQTRRRKRKTYDPDILIRDLAELSVGAPVVHIQHGVARYRGLTTLELDGIESDFLTLEYAEHDKIYVPVTSLDLISRYNGIDPDTAPLHKLGSEKWKKLTRKAKEKIMDVAADLLEIYAKREASKGFAFEVDKLNYQKFTSAFPFQETLDQENAIHAVIKDMCADQPLDRLICGDVGFGKTEVAMRAAFIAVNNHKQVALLVPTTLLASQHFQNFTDRFADFPITIEVLSRFRTQKESTEILKKLAEHKVDIIIGTHKLLQKNVKFSDLGLVIIDEEHRFGVKQKERLKALRSSVDILSMTATPIPRTLNMSLSGMREISLISTPPAKRLSIKTFLHEWNPSVIREAIMRECLRGGQVFFLHNDVITIQAIKYELEDLVPTAKIQIAHGQMRERELEMTMRDFYHGRFNVLLCTTIIETGIDVPTANTIIINKANRFGLAQLHQLRGRVGRSHHQAYAYLLVPSKKAMTSEAKKRLDAFLSMDDLGAGFNLASHDLEIRGCGELLGEEQSGHIQSIGFDLYMSMLDRAVKMLKDNGHLKAFDALVPSVEINLKVSTIIPDDYISDIQHRLNFYKRISNCNDSDALSELKVELIDRYGKLPESVQRLFLFSHLKLKCVALDIKKVDGLNEGFKIQLKADAKINTEKLLELLNEKPMLIRLSGPDCLFLACAKLDIEACMKKIDWLERSLT